MSNKENVMRTKSKIPVLLERASSKERRDPLKTLPGARPNVQEQAGPSGVKRDKPDPSGARRDMRMPDMRHVVMRREDEGMPDMRHVTCMRGERENLDAWRYDVYKVFRDIEEVKASSAPDAAAAEVCSEEALMTPLLPVPTQGKSTQKKVKRSLKRAHTKDLQSFASPTLKAVKREHQTTAQGVSAAHDWPPVYAEDYVSDNLKYLLKIEKRPRLNHSLGRTSRCCIVNWIVNLNGSNGNPAVVQLACWYMDSYLNKSSVPLERLQLVAAACYWIAAKVHGVGVTSTRLERWSGFAFTTRELAATEIQVLRTLNFPCIPCVVHDFVPYLCAWCRDATGALASGAAYIALCVALVYKFGSDYPPSVVAAACVRCALRLSGDCAGVLRLEECPFYMTAVKKVRDFRAVTVLVRNAVRTVTSRGFEYKAPFNKYAGPPHFAALKITEAVNNAKIVREDQRLKACTDYSELV